MRLSASRYFTLALLAFIASFVLLPSSKAVNNFFYIFLALPALVLILLGKVQRPQVSMEVGLWSVFFVWLALSGMGGPGQFFKHVIYTLLFCLIMWLWVEYQRFSAVQLFRILFWGLIVYVSGSAVVFWLTGRLILGERLYSLPGRMEGPILTSMLIVSCFALLLPEWLRNRRWLQVSMAVFSILFCVGFVLQSRSGLVGLTVLLVVTCATLFWQGGWALRTASLVASASLVLAGFWLFQHSELGQELVVRGDSGRFELWHFYLDAWFDCGVLWGCGTGFADNFRIGTGLLIEHPHNIFLAMGFRYGLSGLLLFALLMLVTLWQAWKQKNPWGGYLLISLFMLNFDGRELINSPHEVWLLVLLPSMLIAVQHRAERDKK